MKTTYEHFSEIAEEITETDIYNLMNMYNNGDERALAKIFVDNYGYIQQIQNKYYTVDDVDRDSLAIVNLQQAISDFDVSKNCSVLTLFRTYFRRDLKDKLRKQDADKRIDSETASLDKIQEEMGGELNLPDDSSSETKLCKTLDIDVDNSDIFTDAEKRVLKVFIKYEGRVNQTDVAEELGISRMAVSKTLKRIRNKKEDVIELIFS